jgi:hypothetical protein
MVGILHPVGIMMETCRQPVALRQLYGYHSIGIIEAVTGLHMTVIKHPRINCVDIAHTPGGCNRHTAANWQTDVG